MAEGGDGASSDRLIIYSPDWAGLARTTHLYFRKCCTQLSNGIKIECIVCRIIIWIYDQSLLSLQSVSLAGAVVAVAMAQSRTMAMEACYRKPRPVKDKRKAFRPRSAMFDNTSRGRNPALSNSSQISACRTMSQHEEVQKQ